MKKKISIALAAFAFALLLVVGSVAGTFAYLTSVTPTVSNTFTVGNVAITLDETDVDVYGVKDSETRVTTNAYKLVPKHNYVKDPTVHVQANSEACYLFVKVVNGISAIEAGTTIAAQITANGWTELDGVDNVYYMTVDATGDSIVNKPIFTNFTIADDAEVASYVNATIDITAYAVQQDGLTNVDDAWNAVKNISATNP